MVSRGGGLRAGGWGVEGEAFARLEGCLSC